MDGQPEILSSEARGPRTGCGRAVAVAALAVLLLACLGALGYMAAQLARRDATIHQLRAAQQRATRRQSHVSTGSADLPAVAGIGAINLPRSAGGTFSVVAAAVRPRPGAPPLTWLFVYGQHATPGARYSLLDGTCRGQFVTPADAAQAVADSKGHLTLIAPDLPFSAQDRGGWVLVYRTRDGVTLGGVRGPFIGGRSVPFKTTPPC
jgi:hypothetical protein